MLQSSVGSVSPEMVGILKKVAKRVTDRLFDVGQEISGEVKKTASSWKISRITEEGLQVSPVSKNLGRSNLEETRGNRSGKEANMTRAKKEARLETVIVVALHNAYIFVAVVVVILERKYKVGI